MILAACGHPARATFLLPLPMRQFALLTAASALLLASCEAPPRWHTWETVKAVRHAGPSVKQPAVAYAEKLHAALQTARVEHKVVTFKFRYRSRLLLNREGQETAVIYRDPATPADPWWLMSNRLFSPVWLPTQPVASQVAFYVRRPATVVEVEDFPAEIHKPEKGSKSVGKKHLKKKKTGKKNAKGGKSAVKPAAHSAKAKLNKRK